MISVAALVGRYWRTLRHLKPVQIYGRILFRVVQPRPQPTATPPFRHCDGVWRIPARRAASMIGPRVFRFLNLVGDLDVLGWNNDSLDKLWLYNQHYFDDLNALDSSTRVEWHGAIIADWLAFNPPGHGCGWEAYPTSLRIVNWLKWSLAGNTLSQEALHSLATQTRWLMRRLEWHLMGNHLFVNAKALVFAGLYFDGPEAAAWLDKGLSILRREVPEQILPDGGQFELSPMYHSLAVEDVLDLVNITRCFRGGLSGDMLLQAMSWSVLVEPMLAWLKALCHPDGEIAFFNDAAIGVAPSPAELAAYAAALGFPPPAPMLALTMLKSSGYVRINRAKAALLADVGPVGPDHLPAHAHADTLSFELSLSGRRVIVNSGTSVYGSGRERVRQRGTEAHSTLLLDGENSSEVWGGFRVGRRARVVGIKAVETSSAVELEASHDGFRHLRGRPIHRRSWSLSDAGLSILDEISGKGVHETAIYFRFGPQVAVASGPGRSFRVSDAEDGSEIAIISIALDAEAAIIPTTWHPGFGRSETAVCLRICRSGPAPYLHTTLFRWS